MTRNAEAALLVGAATVAAFGVILVNLAQGDGIDAQVALTFIVMLAAFGSFHLAVRQWSPEASPYLLPLAALLLMIGFVVDPLILLVLVVGSLLAGRPPHRHWLR